MKKRKFVATFLSITTLIGLASCGNNSSSNTTSSSSSVISQVSSSSSSSSSSNQVTSNSSAFSSSSTSENVELRLYKSAAHSKLDELVVPSMNSVSNDSLKEMITNYYNSEKEYIDNIIDLEEAKLAVSKVVEDTKDFAINLLKPYAISKLNEIVFSWIDKIEDEELKNATSKYYQTEMEIISKVESLDDVIDAFKNILEDTKKYIGDEAERILVELKNKAIEELEPYVAALIEKIPYDTLKEDTKKFYSKEIEKLKAISAVEEVENCVKEIKADLENYALTETKKIAVAKFQDYVNEQIEKIPNPEFKEDLSDFSNKEISKLNAVSNITDIPSTLETIMKETKDHVKNLLVSTLKEYLARLTAVETATAYDYLPEAMQPSYENNLVNSSDINYNFTSFTNVSNLNKSGYGEQWQMIVENINQSVAMAKVFNVIQTILNSAGNAVDIYITNSYSEEISYSFEGENYTCLFEFKNSKLTFNINVTKEVTFAGFGAVKPIIRMEYDLVKDAKGIFISLGDAYKVKYVISDNLYEMATTYGITISGKHASRASYLSIEKQKGTTVGHIYEYTTYQDSDMIKACADFYVKDGYVSVVGNKSSGMIGFSGFINELYLANEGRLLGYEVREEMTVAGIKGTYNTLWFNLWDIKGINTVKVLDKSDSNKSEKSTVDVYLNGSSSLLKPTYNSKLTIKTSRKYDIEYRSRYYYTYDLENEKYIANEVKVPMMFIQEGDNFNSFETDIKNDNKLDASVQLSKIYLNKILDDYDTLIDVFIQNKDNMSSEMIISYLEQYEG